MRRGLRTRFGFVLLIGMIFAALLARLQAPRPRLVVVLSIDQFRGDYLSRYGDLLLPAVDKDGRIGGFRYLIEPGVYTEPVEIVDLAPTLAALLGIEPPSGADGHLLRAALR